MKFTVPTLVAISVLLSNCSSESSHSDKKVPTEENAEDTQEAQKSIDSSMNQQLEQKESKESKESVDLKEPKESKEEPIAPTDPKDPKSIILQPEAVTLMKYDFAVPFEQKILGKFASLNEGLIFEAAIKSNMTLNLEVIEIGNANAPVRTYKKEILLKSDDYEKYLSAAKSLSNVELVSKAVDPNTPICMKYVPLVSDRTSLSIASGYDANSNTFSGGLTTVHAEQVCWHTDYAYPKQAEKKKEAESLEQELHSIAAQYANDYAQQSARANLESLKKTLSQAKALEISHSGMGMSEKYAVDFDENVITTFKRTMHTDEANQHGKYRMKKGLEEKLRTALGSLDVSLPVDGTCTLASDWDNRTIEIVLNDQKDEALNGSYFIVAGETNIESLCGLSNRVFTTTDEDFKELVDILKKSPATTSGQM